MSWNRSQIAEMILERLHLAAPKVSLEFHLPRTVKSFVVDDLLPAELASAIAKAATRANVAFLDAGAHIAISPVDGIHYEPAAHATLALALAAALRENFPS